ncbi:hypothetical protein [Streptomyces sp. NPDC048734]|uniref:hypothetical protein n=1 Tax=Streptomyces sp. NPDC048734 TaxID=3365590 RepID=UPI00372097A2
MTRVRVPGRRAAALGPRAGLEVFEEIRAPAGGGRTVAPITYRPASVRHTRLVRVLDQGRLVEAGTPDEGGVEAEPCALRAKPFTGPPTDPGPAAKAG